ncbi:ADP-ribose glycohydrolase MACROD1 isoform X2 [Maylandia zebra]|uniref:Mono-ADP ribosylhydrolase 1 n=1 Tax=Maylandia zebra TaxID=106582 RepID=A0A3P9B7S5_9CICH|nr:O-acetyl-ADP-ribose deacetylase MACROD1 isoform X2 [Maylandia zebra]
MALQVSARVSRIGALPYYTGGPLSRVSADTQSVGVKFKHILTPGSPQLGRRPATSAPRSHINAVRRTDKFSTTTPLWRSSRGTHSSLPQVNRGWLGKFALGTAFGVSTAVLVQSLHTGAFTAMALKINLDSDKEDWKKTKDYLLSLSVEDRRQYYWTTDYKPLDEISVWTPTAGGSQPTDYKRNEKLDQKISLYNGDITKLEIDAIVNAANNTLLGGGGVDGAIHRAAGPMLKKECASLNGCKTGEAKITCGYRLPAKFARQGSLGQRVVWATHGPELTCVPINTAVTLLTCSPASSTPKHTEIQHWGQKVQEDVIHTVGPIAQGGVGEEEKNALRSCYRNSLETATENGARSVAFPCISTGIYGYPSERAVHEALKTVRDYLDAHHDKLDRVIFCVFLPKDQKLYEENLPLYFPAA